MLKLHYKSNLTDKEVIVSINKAIDSSIDLRNKKELIEKFVASLTPTSDIDDAWNQYVKEQKKAELERIITEESLKPEETINFINNSFKNGEIQAAGTAFASILPPVSRFSPTGERTLKKETVLEKLKKYFDRFFDISNGEI